MIFSFIVWTIRNLVNTSDNNALLVDTDNALSVDGINDLEVS